MLTKKSDIVSTTIMSDIDIKRISYLAKLKLPSEKEEVYSQSLVDIIQWVDN